MEVRCFIKRAVVQEDVLARGDGDVQHTRTGHILNSTSSASVKVAKCVVLVAFPPLSAIF